VSIDTAAKRRAAAFVSRRFMRPAVTPDTAKPVGWRQQVVWGYSGIAPSTVTPITAPSVPDTYMIVDPTADALALLDPPADTLSITDPTADTYPL